MKKALEILIDYLERFISVLFDPDTNGDEFQTLKINIMEVSLIFVYHNDEKNKIKVLSLTQAKERNDHLLANGWKHTATIDPRRWIEYLFNETEDIVAEIRNELSARIKDSK